MQLLLLPQFGRQPFLGLDLLCGRDGVLLRSAFRLGRSLVSSFKHLEKQGHVKNVGLVKGEDGYYSD